MNAVEMTAVSKTLNGNKILDNISMAVGKGQFCALRGENGSGKTMLLRAIAGMLRIDSGRINVQGKEIRMGKPPESIGIVIENMEFWPGLTGWEILRSLSMIKNLISDRDIIHAMETIGLDPADKRKFRQYSLGMKKRLAIAQAIMERPSLVLLDEPSSSLDPEGKKMLDNLLKRLHKEGTTCIMASHIQEEVFENADRFFIMDKGTLKEAGL